MKNVKEIMSIDNPKWDEFYTRLEGPEGCNIRTDDSGKLVWNCGGGKDKTFAIKILSTMPKIDIGASIKYLDEHGGYCDCEILMNVDDSDEE